MTDINSEQRIAELEAQILVLKDALAAQHEELEAKRSIDFDKVKKAVDNSAQTVLNAVRPIIERYEEPSRAAVAKVGSKVSDNPFLSVVVAFGAGIVIGELLKCCCRCDCEEE